MAETPKLRWDGTINVSMVLSAVAILVTIIVAASSALNRIEDQAKSFEAFKQSVEASLSTLSNQFETLNASNLRREAYDRQLQDHESRLRALERR